MNKLHNHRYPPGLERVILRRIPRYLLASIVIPLIMVILVRIPQVASLFTITAEEAVRFQTIIDYLAIAIFVATLPIIIALTIGCLVVILMKGPAYVADAYEIDDADEPDDNNI